MNEQINSDLVEDSVNQRNKYFESGDSKKYAKITMETLSWLAGEGSVRSDDSVRLLHELHSSSAVLAVHQIRQAILHEKGVEFAAARVAMFHQATRNIA